METARDPEVEKGKPRRIGVFGGTFDPPHAGHVSVARDVSDAIELDELIWVPAGHPPHKPEEGLSPADVRLEMTRAAARADPRFTVDAREVRRAGPSFTVDTLGELEREIEGASIFLVIGADQLRDFDGWRAPEKILRLACLAAFDRDGRSAREVRGTALSDARRIEAADLPREPELPCLVFVPVTRVDVSATAIREAVSTGGDLGGLVPRGVRRIIEAEGLYRP